jgi:dTDP-4-amino-4,6-dideoxygalactose transaminase
MWRGEPVFVEAIADLAVERSIRLVEDCAQAFGAEAAGRPVGTFGDLAVFSTMADKHLSTGGQGGIVFHP